jgi:hypothetical protein
MAPSVLAAAGDETTPGVLVVVPTIECIGVTSSFTGDNNQNNNALLEYRESGAASWKTAPQMYADRGNRQYRGSIFWLKANTDYEVRVTYTDPDGVSGGPVSAIVRTREDNPPSNGKTYYVSMTGSDSAAGSLAAPWKTIAHAASVVTAGDTVNIISGVPAEHVDMITSGTPNNYITFQSYTTPKTVLDANFTIATIFQINGSYIILLIFHQARQVLSLRAVTL